MPKIYFNAGTREVYIDISAGKTVTVPLQKDADPFEVSYVLGSSTLREIISVLVEKER